MSTPWFRWNLPTVLTLLRLASVPLLAVLLSFSESEIARDVAAAVFLLAALSDFADGALARKRNQVTGFGTLMDPIADKALIAVALIGLSVLGEIPWWITSVIVIREVGVTLLRMRVVRQKVVPASMGGKAKTVAQIVAITMYLLAWNAIPGWDALSLIALYVALVLTVVTGIDYVIRIQRLRARS